MKEQRNPIPTVETIIQKYSQILLVRRKRLFLDPWYVILTKMFELYMFKLPPLPLVVMTFILKLLYKFMNVKDSNIHMKYLSNEESLGTFYYILYYNSCYNTRNIVAAHTSTTAREIGTKLLIGNFNGRF